MNRKICLSLFPHRPLSFHGLTFADGGWLLMHLQTFAERYFSHGSAKAGRRSGVGVVGAGRRVSKGLFSMVVPCSWLLQHQSLAIEGTGLQINSVRGTSSSSLWLMLVALLLPWQRKQPLWIICTERSAVGGGEISRQGQRDGGQQDSPSYITDHSSPFSSWGFPGLRLYPAPPRASWQLMAEGGGGSWRKSKATLTDVKTCAAVEQKSQCLKSWSHPIGVPRGGWGAVWMAPLPVDLL